MPCNTVERRSSGGKNFRLTVLLHSGRVDKISLTGDFFIVPEEGLEILEDSLLDLAEQGSKERAGERLRTAMDDRGIRMVGITPEDLTSALWEALP